jgi:hypothetical protein
VRRINFLKLCLLVALIGCGEQEQVCHERAVSAEWAGPGVCPLSRQWIEVVEGVAICRCPRIVNGELVNGPPAASSSANPASSAAPAESE